MRKFFRRIVTLVLTAAILLSCVPLAGAQNNWNMEYFLRKYSDPHFNLANDPNRAMTVEEFLAIVYAYSYYGDGVATVTARDKNGAAPSAWAARYVQAEVNKGIVDTARLSWSQPATLAFAAQYLVRAKGKYSYDAVNFYSFTGTQGLNADDILYLNAAVDFGLIPYTPGMNVSQPILRRDARRYEVPGGTVTAKPAAAGSANTMRELHGYFVDCYWDLDEANRQFAALKQAADDFTMVTFQCAYLNGQNVDSGNSYLGCSLDHRDAVAVSDSYTSDPQMDAVSWCRENGKLTFLGVTNAGNNQFQSGPINAILNSSSAMNTAADEIVQAVVRYDLDGVNLGIELRGNNGMRAAFANFLSVLSNKLHAQGKLLLTTVGAVFTEKQEQESFYDYAAAAQYSDYIHVILYDDFEDTGYASRGTDGAISNLTRINRVIRYAVAKMGADKLLLGTGSFATDFTRSPSKSAKDISYAEAERQRRQYGAGLNWESLSASCYYDYTDAAGASHRVYMESTTSIDARAKVMQQYGLCGFSTFYIGGEAQALWDRMSAASAYKPEIMSAMQAGLIPTELRRQYGKAITRQEFCRLIAQFLEVCPAVSEGTGSASFTDCRDSAVQTAARLGIVTGYNDGTFRPNNTITRQEAATMLTRLAKCCGMEEPNDASVSFSELSSMQAWAQDGVRFISACEDPTTNRRVMGGTGNNKFSPTATYTREQSMMTAIRLYHAIEQG